MGRRTLKRWWTRERRGDFGLSPIDSQDALCLHSLRGREAKYYYYGPTEWAKEGVFVLWENKLSCSWFTPVLNYVLGTRLETGSRLPTSQRQDQRRGNEDEVWKRKALDEDFWWKVLFLRWSYNIKSSVERSPCEGGTAECHLNWKFHPRLASSQS